ncbi:MAG TPA: AIR synthase-related protein [Tepidisphaeraceae bacterium]|nr:AIR synthase-related protein [Tepidisphaeraceae bacterium]
MAELSYKSAGVDYESLDAFKRACQSAALSTRAALAEHQLAEPADVRGDSAYLLETESEFIAHVEEGLGTKNLIADAMASLTGQCFYRAMGIDTVATIVNDCVTCGALPFSVAMHAGVGDSSWFADQARAAALAEGFAEGCRQANAVWGGGETPALKGIIEPHAIVLAGSAVGRIKPKSRRILGNIQPGDAIIFVSSSGVQTNGLTLCRTLADRLPAGYRTPMADGREYGEALLDPSVIYVRLIADLAQAGFVPHYAVHVTGHGWRKLMRAIEPMVYRITDPGAAGPEVFRFIQSAGGLETREMYATFNMGVGFAVYVAPDDAERVLSIARSAGYTAWLAGTLVKEGQRKAVDIVPLGIQFESDTLQVR